MLLTKKLYVRRTTLTDRSKFTLLEGGLSVKKEDTLKFKSAWVTDTRLMGVISIGIHWESVFPNIPDYYQFFYFEAEELGFDRYESYIGEENEHLTNLEASIIGGLGACKVPVTEEECIFLLSKFREFNKIHNIPLPEDNFEYMYLMNQKAELSQEQINLLYEKMCTSIPSKIGVANYFLMRYTGRDLIGLKYLYTKDINSSFFAWSSPGTFHHNKVRLSADENSARCESVIEEGGRFHILVSHLTFTDMKVNEFEVLSDMIISHQEAFMALTHSEFITVFQYSGEIEDFNRNSTALTKNAMITAEHNGSTFMIFNPTNDHVNDENYYLYNDLLGIFHMDKSGEFLLASPSEDNIEDLEADLLFSHHSHSFKYIGSYEFNEPILLQYFESDFPSFMEFIAKVQEEDNYDE